MEIFHFGLIFFPRFLIVVVIRTMFCSAWLKKNCWNCRVFTEGRIISPIWSFNKPSCVNSIWIYCIYSRVLNHGTSMRWEDRTSFFYSFEIFGVCICFVGRVFCTAFSNICTFVLWCERVFFWIYLAVLKNVFNK